MSSFTPVTIVLYFIAFALTLVGLHFLGLAEFLPNNNNLLNWDASWYASIATDGYQYSTSTQSNAGFFPLFPKIWDTLNLSPIGVSIFNICCFSLGFYWIVKSFEIKFLKSIWLLSLPSILFFLVPYSEALFFLFSVGFIVNYKNKKDGMALLFVLMMGLVRPIFLFFIPAIGVLLMIQKFWKKENLKHIAFPLIALSSSILAFWIISLETGDFFSYSNSQTEHWNHKFGLPRFPFTTWRGYRILWLDAAALFTILFSIALLTSTYLKSKNNKIIEQLNRTKLLQVFSVVYLAMIVLYVTFFHMEDNGRTSLLSINRYVFTCPFLFFLMGTLELDGKVTLASFFKPLIFALGCTLILIGWPYMTIVGLDHLSSVIFGLVLIGYISIQVLAYLNINRLVTFAIIALNLLIQVYLYQSFLKGNWIG